MTITKSEHINAYPISVIIPVLNEQARINQIIAHINKIDPEIRKEIIVADCDPDKSTLNSIISTKVIKAHAPKGRAVQMNYGARKARGDILLFMHADTLLPDNAFAIIERIMSNKTYVAGAFDLSIGSPRCSIRFIAAVARIRSRITRVPFGDQTLFIRKEYFESLKGFAEIPLMEDVELLRRIRKKGDFIFIAHERVITSARKWEEEGALYTTLRNWTIRYLYLLGVKPHKLIKRYYK